MIRVRRVTWTPENQSLIEHTTGQVGPRRYPTMRSALDTESALMIVSFSLAVKKERWAIRGRCRLRFDCRTNRPLRREAVEFGSLQTGSPGKFGEEPYSRRRNSVYLTTLAWQERSVDTFIDSGA